MVGKPVKALVVILVVIAVAAALISILTSKQSVNLSSGTNTSVVQVIAQELRIGLSTSISTIDIHFATGVADFEVLGKVYEALFKIDVDESGRLVYKPWLAEKFIQVNSTAYLVILRSGVKFHNGKVMDAWDVKASIERSMNYSPIGKMLLRDASGQPLIDRIGVVNSTALIIVLRKPFAFLPEHLAHLAVAVMPRDIAEKYGEKPINSTSDVVGTGPYRVVEYSPGSYIVLEAFDGYWQGSFKIRRVEYRFISDSTARLAALFNGDIDIAVGVPPDMASDVASRGFRILSVVGTRLVIVAINVNSVPDAIVRQAFNYAVDKKAIVDSILKGYATVAQWVVPPIFPGVVPQQPYEYNPEKARQMLESAGFKQEKPLRFLVSTRSPKDLEVAQAVQRYLKNVGVDVEIVPMEHTAFLKAVFNQHDFDLALYGPSPSSLYYGLTYWRTGSSLNGPNYSNPTYDRLLDEAASEMDETRRAQQLAEAQKILWNDCPAIWLYAENFIYAVNPKVEGIRIVLAYFDLSKAYVKG